MKLTTKLITAIAAVAATCWFSAPSALAQAGNITGKVNFTGAATLNTQNLATATRVNSWADTMTTSQSANTGSFSGVPTNTPVTFFAPWNFNSGPITNFWMFNSTGGNFRFDLISSMVMTQNSSFLNVSGIGTISGTNSMGQTFNPTFGRWAFSIQDSSAGGGGTFTFSFSADTSAIPEGGSAIALLGVGLVAVEVIRRKLATA